MEAPKLTPLEQQRRDKIANTPPTLDDAYDEDGKVDIDNVPEAVLARIPNPTGWRIAILPFRGSKSSKGGILLAEETQKRAQLATNCGYVLRMGNLAYSDESKYPNGPWCKVGDWIIFGRYAGSRIQIDGGEIRLLNDDEVLGLINDPKDVLHM
jgi:co-chaperonin GroES (HSP10)